MTNVFTYALKKGNLTPYHFAHCELGRGIVRELGVGVLANCITDNFWDVLDGESVKIFLGGMVQLNVVTDEPGEEPYKKVLLPSGTKIKANNQGQGVRCAPQDIPQAILLEDVKASGTIVYVKLL